MGNCTDNVEGESFEDGSFELTERWFLIQWTR